MTRDTFDRFQPQDRGMFGENEQRQDSDNRVTKSKLCDLDLFCHNDNPSKLAIAVSTDIATPFAKWIWLPRSLIEVVKTGAIRNDLMRIELGNSGDTLIEINPRPSVRLHQRAASSKPALLISLRKTIMAGLKWKATEAFGLAIGADDLAGKVRIIRRKDKAKVIASPRSMKTGALTFDFGHVASFGVRGTLKAEAIAVIIDADTVEVTIPTFEYEDEIEEGDADDEPEREAETAPSPMQRASPSSASSVRAAADAARGVVNGRRLPPLTVGGVTISFDHECEAVTFNRKTMEVTTKQAHFIATLAKAMSQPVGRDFITKKVFPDMVPTTAPMVLDQIAMDLTKALPRIGLQLKNVKGIGFALSEAA